VQPIIKGERLPRDIEITFWLIEAEGNNEKDRSE
jgi:hypothetical protein